MADSPRQQPTRGFFSGEDALRQMPCITADYDRSFEAKVSNLLELGRSYLGV